MTPSDAAARYAQFWETITPESIANVEAYFAPDARFRDPFNDVTGIAGCRRILEKMFEDCHAPRFQIGHIACDQDICYLRWSFEFQRKPGATAHRIDGVSEVRFDAEGRVLSHIDHWDAARLYEKVPVLGAVLRAIRRRLSI